MKLNSILYFILVNLLIIPGVFFTHPVSAQGPVNIIKYNPLNKEQGYPSRQYVTVPNNNNDISEIDTCYSQNFTIWPNFDDVPGLQEKIPDGVTMWVEWGVGGGKSTYTNVEAKKNWSYKEVVLKTDKVFTAKNLKPNTIYSWVIVLEIPISGTSIDRKVIKKFNYPKFFKTNQEFLCIAEAEKLFFKELDFLSTLALFSPNKKTIATLGVQKDPDAIPLSLVPSGTKIGPIGKCKDAKMSQSGAIICSTIVDNFNAMVKAIKTEVGLELKSGSFAGARSIEMQRIMRDNRGCRNDTETMCPGGQIAAVGKSNHGNADAADFACYKNNEIILPFANSPCYQWLAINGNRFGLKNNLPKDRVHFSPTGN